MSFRPSNQKICHTFVAGWLCLAGVCGSRAGEPIEVVPFRGSAPVDTNFDQALPSDTKNLEAMFPHATHSFNPPRASIGNLPPQPPQQNAPLSQRDKELIDRRRNWVFMTPDDFAKSGSDKDSSVDDQKADNGKSSTAMERYYQHLVDLDNASATNALGSEKPDRDSWTTNSSSWDAGKGDSSFASSPFNTLPAHGVFQTPKAGSFGNVFGSAGSAALPGPEQVRAEAEQKAHMDSFKELWNMTAQPAAAPAPTPPPVLAATPVSGFDSVQSSMRPALNALSPAQADSGAAPSSSWIAPRTITSMRNGGPPHATFAPPQNPF